MTSACEPVGSLGPAWSPDDSDRYSLTLNVNGQSLQVKVAAETTILELLRDDLGLTGTKKGCGLGHCGACTILLNDRRVTSCLTLVVMYNGSSITTIEGLGDAENLDLMQEAFIQHDALQCGYCTPGQIMSAVGCVAEGHCASDAEIREWMSGNICRCGAYTNIVAAVARVARGER